MPHGKRLRRAHRSVTFAGLDIGDMAALPLKRAVAAVGVFHATRRRLPPKLSRMPRKKRS